MNLSLDQLCQMMPNLPIARSQEAHPYLCQAMEEFDISTSPYNICAFIAQLAHESGELRYMEEIASGQAYDNRADLGNTRPEAIEAARAHNTTPGRFYKGHGPLQVTGYDNHKRVGDKLGIDTVNNPGLLATFEYGFRAAGLYWKDEGLSSLAVQDMKLVKLAVRKGGVVSVPAFHAISYKVNGGWNGRDERLRYYVRNKKVMGLKT